jgi:hypothetical protein
MIQKIDLDLNKIGRQNYKETAQMSVAVVSKGQI